MPESFGAQFPEGGVQQGHRHVDSVAGFIYRYLGGDPSNELNWMVDGGKSPTDPDTSSWGPAQSGASWYNVTERQQKYWTGTHVRSSSVVPVSISAGALTIDAGSGSYFRLTLDQDLTDLTLVGERDGQKIIIEARQDDVGGYEITWPSNVRFSSALLVGSFVASTDAGDTSYFGLIYNGSAGVFDAIAVISGFSS